MLVLFAKVSPHYGVVDTENGTIAWWTKEQVKTYLAQGYNIRGISDCNGVPNPQFVDLSNLLSNRNNHTRSTFLNT